VVVRLYELRSAGSFKNSDFFGLYDSDSQVLAEDLVAREEFRFNPGESKTVSRILDDATKQIGIMAAFRDLDEASWRQVLPLKLNQTNTYTLLLGRKDISVSIAE
jgi:type VI secretion system protein VasD